MILFDAAKALAGLLKVTQSGTATGGSTTTLVDSVQKENDDYFNGGTVFVTSGNNANKWGIISDYANTSGTFTLSAAISGSAIAAGDTYTATTGHFSINELIGAINSALSEIGGVTKTDTTLTASGAASITLPSGVSDVRRVVVDNVINHHWREVNGSIMFDDGYEPASGAVVLYYNAAPSTVSAASDTLPSEVHLPRLVWTSAAYASLGRVQRTDGDEKEMMDYYKNAREMADRMAILYPIKRMTRDPHMARW